MRRKDYGCGSRRLCRVLLAGFCVLFLALLPLAAWPIGQAEAKKEPLVTEEVPSDMTEEAIPEEQSLKELSGTASENTWTDPSNSRLKAREGKRLTGDEALELYFNLAEAEDEYKAAREASEAKDAEIAGLKAELAEAEEETGSKAYVMLDGIIGFETGIPQFGAGFTIGTRIGNSLMLEAGADYMVGGLDGINHFSIDNFQLRTSVGWMF